MPNLLCALVTRSFADFQRVATTPIITIMRSYVIIFNHGIKVGEDFDELTDFI